MIDEKPGRVIRLLFDAHRFKAAGDNLGSCPFRNRCNPSNQASREPHALNMREQHLFEDEIIDNHMILITFSAEPWTIPERCGLGSDGHLFRLYVCAWSVDSHIFVHQACCKVL